MSKVNQAIRQIRDLEDLGKSKTWIHDRHPLAKLLTTVIFLAVVVSFDKSQVSGLLPFFFFPVFLLAMGDVPVKPFIHRVLILSPLVLGIAIFSPILVKEQIQIGGLFFSAGWITFLSLCVKGLLTISIGLLLLATTNMMDIALALRMLKVPKGFVLQLLLTYRFITVLLEEVQRMTMAYALRAPTQKGIAPNAWGSFAGQLILRTYDRAGRLYRAMVLRGFSGEYHTAETVSLKPVDVIYILIWVLFFLIARFNDIPLWLGTFITEGLTR